MCIRAFHPLPTSYLEDFLKDCFPGLAPGCLNQIYLGGAQELIFLSNSQGDPNAGGVLISSLCRRRHHPHRGFVALRQGNHSSLSLGWAERSGLRLKIPWEAGCSPHS